MKKRMLTIAAVTVLAVAMTACSKTQTGNNITPTTVEAETTTAPTAILIPTVEPTVTSTATPTVEPTATPESIATSTPVPTSTPAPTPTNTPVPTSTPAPTPTSTPVPTSTPTPEPTATPVPTEAPKADTKDWKTVLRELHSLETYEEREAYVAKLDKSVYKVEQIENFDLIDKCNSYEGEMYVLDEFGRVQEETYVVYDANYDKVAQYLADELPEDFWKTYGPEKYAFKDKTWRIATEYTYDELPEDFWDFFEFNGCTYKDYNVIFGPCAYVLVDDSFETVREYAINELPEDFWNDYDINSTFYYDGYMALVQYPDLPYYIELEWVDVTTKGPVYADLEGILAYNWEPFGETAYLMTITNVATGETDPWGVCYGRSVTMEEAVNVYESSYASEWGPALVIDYEMVYGCEPAHIKTWDTLKYYEDLVNLN